MGLFGSFNAIGKIYSHLRKIEPMLNEVVNGHRAMTDRNYLNLISQNITIEINDIRRIVETSGNTVKCADFQFMGSKKSIYQILADVEMINNMAVSRPI